MSRDDEIQVIKSVFRAEPDKYLTEHMISKKILENHKMNISAHIVKQRLKGIPKNSLKKKRIRGSTGKRPMGYRLLEGNSPLSIPVNDKDISIPSYEVNPITGPVEYLVNKLPFGYGGVKTHVKEAEQQFQAGKYADMTRSAVHAVEAIGYEKTKKEKIRTALSQLEKNKKIDRPLKDAVIEIYSWASDEPGVRHSLRACPNPEVSEDTAVRVCLICFSAILQIIDSSDTPPNRLY